MSTSRTIRIPVKTTVDYLQIFRGIFGLTDEEVRVLGAFMDIREEILKEGRASNPFSIHMKRRVATVLKRKDPYTLNTYIKALKDKGAIIPSDNGYVFHPIIDPTRLGQNENITLEVVWPAES